MSEKEEKKTGPEEEAEEVPAPEEPREAATEEAASEAKPEDAAPEAERKEPEDAAEPAEAAEAAPETFTVTKEQMEKLEALAAELSAQKDKYLRLAAEYDNYRKRTAKEKESLYADAKIDTITAMLPVYDNLERGLAQYKDEEADSPHRKGLEMVFWQFTESLSIRTCTTP